MCPTRVNSRRRYTTAACWAHFRLSAIPDRGGQKVKMCPVKKNKKILMKKDHNKRNLVHKIKLSLTLHFLGYNKHRVLLQFIVCFSAKISSTSVLPFERQQQEKHKIQNYKMKQNFKKLWSRIFRDTQLNKEPIVNTLFFERATQLFKIYIRI
jgi:hypothetical protein